ncbi:MAG TPA: DUF1800 domain-containing protein [Acidobacteriaceae bacterium]
MSQILHQGLRALTATILCLLMAGQPMLYAAPKPPARVTAPDPAGTLQGDDRILHALNRFTYGPRPGDVDAVKKMGLDRWFAQQLNPGSIDNSDLQARMAQYPAMQLNEEQLMMRFPSRQMIRAITNGLQPMPKDPVEHAIYADQIYFYNLYKDKLGAVTPVPVMAVPADTSMQKDGAAAGNDMAGNEMAGDAMMPVASAQTGKGRKAAAASAIERNGDAMSAADVQAIVALPVQARYDRILAMTPQQLLTFRNGSNRYRGQIVEGMTPEQREVMGALGNSRQVVTGELMAATLEREVYSSRQLQEVMTDFWLNHFNVYIKKNEITPYQLVGYVRDTIAPHALGHFEDLLVATAKSSAMLSYLDNMQSTGPDSLAAKRNGGNNPRIQERLAKLGNTPDAKTQIAQVQQQRKNSGLNENYARELMELHTLGVNGGYTQHDVTEVAKVFTGWTLDRPYRGGQFNFDERRHEPGTKAVLGNTIREGGVNEGLEVLHMLATSPQTAHFISRELAVRFVADEPPATLVDRMAATFLASKGDMKAVLTTMYKSPEFWSKDAYRAKVKTPLEYVLSAVRASDAQMKTPIALGLALDRLGMPIFGCQPPTGYYWRASDWVSTSALVSRMNFALALSVNALPGVTADWNSVLQEGGIASAVPTVAGVFSPKEKELRLESVLMNRPVSEKTRHTVLEQAALLSVEDAASKFPIDLNDIATLSGGKGGGGGGGKNAANRDRRIMGQMGQNPEPNDREASLMAGLLLGSPEFQRR